MFADLVTVGTLSREALIEVIEQPVWPRGADLRPPSLPQRMVTDTDADADADGEDGDGDAVPLLAYALQELCLAADPSPQNRRPKNDAT